MEHAFGVIKRLRGYRKMRYLGLAKYTAQVFTLFALANFYLSRRELAVTLGSIFLQVVEVLIKLLHGDEEGLVNSPNVTRFS